MHFCPKWDGVNAPTHQLLTAFADQRDGVESGVVDLDLQQPAMLVCGVEWGVERLKRPDIPGLESIDPEPHHWAGCGHVLATHQAAHDVGVAEQIVVGDLHLVSRSGRVQVETCVEPFEPGHPGV